jgi:hypothetical protein
MKSATYLCLFLGVMGPGATASTLGTMAEAQVISATAASPDGRIDCRQSDGPFHATDATCGWDINLAWPHGTLPPPADFWVGSGEARSHAHFGDLHAYATASDLYSPAFAGGTADAQAWFTDFLTVTQLNSGVPFSGFLRVDGILEGTASASGSAVAQAAFSLGLSSLSGGSPYCTLFVNTDGANDNACSATIAVNPGDVIEMDGYLNAFAHVTDAGNVVNNIATADFANTARILGIQALDANGNPVSAVISAASGTVYGATDPAPEPGTIELITGGMLCLIGGIARTRQRGKRT